MSSELSKAMSGLTALTSLIDDHDAALWQVGEPPFAKLRHIHMHLSKCAGKLAGVVEPTDHEADAVGTHDVDFSEHDETLADLAADLVIHAAQISRLANVDLSAALLRRWRRNAARFGPETSFAALLDED